MLGRYEQLIVGYIPTDHRTRSSYSVATRIATTPQRTQPWRNAGCKALRIRTEGAGRGRCVAKWGRLPELECRRSSSRVPSRGWTRGGVGREGLTWGWGEEPPARVRGRGLIPAGRGGSRVRGTSARQFRGRLNPSDRRVRNGRVTVHERLDPQTNGPEGFGGWNRRPRSTIG